MLFYTHPAMCVQQREALDVKKLYLEYSCLLYERKKILGTPVVRNVWVFFFLFFFLMLVRLKMDF